MKLIPLASAMLLAGSVAALAHDVPAEVAKSPPAGAFKAVSSLVKLPDFLPGMGQLFVDPATLPAGPFLAYDHDGALVSTIYMLPMKDLNPDKSFDDLAAPGGDVDHVDVYYNAGHPGVEEPHVHVVLWHVAEGRRSAGRQMILTRRRMMEAGGGILAAFIVGPAVAAAVMSSTSSCGAGPTARMSGSTRSACISSPARQCAGPTAIPAIRIR